MGSILPPTLFPSPSTFLAQPTPQAFRGRYVTLKYEKRLILQLCKAFWKTLFPVILNAFTILHVCKEVRV